MAATSPLGISPALLQAISHLQKVRSQSGDAAATRISLDKSSDGGPVIISTSAEGQQHLRLNSGRVLSSSPHILQGMNEPVGTLSAQPDATAETIFVMQADDTTGTLVDSKEGIVSGNQIITVEEKQYEACLEEDSKQVEVNMGSVLSALAKSVQQQKADYIQDENMSAPSLLAASEGSTVKLTVDESSSNGQADFSPPSAKRLCSTDSENSGPIPATLFVSPKFMHLQAGASGKQDNGSVVYRTLHTGPEDGAQPQVPLDPSEMCPICGDKISGYHYGTYTCESCKGFFKRTVQNKKAFVCHRKGDCTITMSNRKKCPACRFKLCISNGMRIEAIREDRARGGRSSYEGCSPHGRPKSSSTDKEPAPRKVLHIRQQQQQQPATSVLSTVANTVTVDTVQDLGNTVVISSGKLSKIEEVTSHVQPVTPQLLEDLSAVESLMMEEEEEHACCAGKLQPGDTHLFSSLLHIADHCLYKIVRWARNLPDFANVSTDDQILLLQNCWAELLCICTCWSSIRETNQLRLSFGRYLTLEQARTMGLGELVERILDFSESMRQFGVDAYEFVAIKALLLLSPDVKNLKNEGVIRQHQEILLDALMSYTTTHFPQTPEKFSRILALLPQLSRCCILGKEQLNKRQEAGEVPAFSLLSELLKGDSAVQ